MSLLESWDTAGVGSVRGCHSRVYASCLWQGGGKCSLWFPGEIFQSLAQENTCPFLTMQGLVGQGECCGELMEILSGGVRWPDLCQESSSCLGNQIARQNPGCPV